MRDGTTTRQLEQFYSAFQRRDHAGMAACYHAEATFTDPVFALRGKEIAAMWHLLCEGGADLQVTFSGIETDGTTGRAHWEARYTFSTSGRKVHNVIDAQFRFKDGLIVEHRDQFDFWRWSRQALGPTGALLGWAPMMQGRVQRTARERLTRFIERHPEYQLGL
jgi:ketosteroid isomerase-like protein